MVLQVVHNTKLFHYLKIQMVMESVLVELAMIYLAYVVVSFGVFNLKSDVNSLDGWYYYTDNSNEDFYVDFNCDVWSTTLIHLLNFVQFGVGFGFTITCISGTTKALKNNAPVSPMNQI
jgi:hypothetical protein